MKGIRLAGESIRDRLYTLDHFSWKTDEDFESGIFKTIECYLEKYYG